MDLIHGHNTYVLKCKIEIKLGNRLKSVKEI